MRKGKTKDYLKLLKHAPDKVDPYKGEKILAIDNENRVNVNFYTEKRCNFACSYCEPENHTSTQIIDIEKYKEAWRTINPRNVSTINISGGEPTLNKNYIDFVKWLKGNNPYARISTSTNGTKSAEYLNHLNTYSHLAISIHFEFITDRYISKLHRFLNSRNDKKSVRLKCMLHPEKVPQVKSFVAQFRKYRDLDMTVTPLWTPGTKEIMEYESEVWSLVA
jgi:MoaA/NifB/PqqE/SkfB family radical SAM enzyme